MVSIFGATLYVNDGISIASVYAAPLWQAALNSSDLAHWYSVCTRCNELSLAASFQGQEVKGQGR